MNGLVSFSLFGWVDDYEWVSVGFVKNSEMELIREEERFQTLKISGRRGIEFVCINFKDRFKVIKILYNGNYLNGRNDPINGTINYRRYKMECKWMMELESDYRLPGSTIKLNNDQPYLVLRSGRYSFKSDIKFEIDHIYIPGKPINILANQDHIPKNDFNLLFILIAFIVILVGGSIAGVLAFKYYHREHEYKSRLTEDEKKTTTTSNIQLDLDHDTKTLDVQTIEDDVKIGPKKLAVRLK